MIPDYVKDQIKERDIVSIIQGEGVELRREAAATSAAALSMGRRHLRSW